MGEGLKRAREAARASRKPYALSDAMDDPAIILQRAEEKLCGCGAAGSGEGHADWCQAEKFDRIPRRMTAADALKHLGISVKGARVVKQKGWR